MIGIDESATLSGGRLGHGHLEALVGPKIPRGQNGGTPPDYFETNICH